MTFQEALKHTKINEKELHRINLIMLEKIYSELSARFEKFKYDSKLKLDCEAYGIILNELKNNR